ncbi:MAG: hypothetical protein V4591_05175 [Bdellovibrionota bacterium]
MSNNNEKKALPPKQVESQNKDQKKINPQTAHERDRTMVEMQMQKLTQKKGNLFLRNGKSIVKDGFFKESK